jgi:hypothetical protein
LWLFKDGLFVQHRRARFAGRFDDIRGVYFEDRTALRLQLPGRLSVRLTGADGATLRGLVNRAAPALLSRCVAEYERGETVDFGALRLQRDRLGVRGVIGWKWLPLRRLSGWVARDGWLFLDEGERPRRFAEVRLRRVANLQALTVLLRKQRPDADLTQPVNALRHAAKGRTWLSRPATALARKPETAARVLSRWAIYAAAVAAGGWAGVHWDADARLLAQADTVRWLWFHLHG